MIAFWKYDLFPGLLSGTVVRLTEDGRVLTREYGPGFYFRPALILDDETGAALARDLESLRIQRNKEKMALDLKYDEKVKAALANINPLVV